MAFLYPDIVEQGNRPIVTPQSPEGKELRRWELPKSQGGMNRDGYEEFPKCLYKAGRPTQGNVMITESHTVRSADEEAIAVGQGWSKTQEDAIQLVHATHTELGKLAANRAYHEQRMSEGARAEAASYESETIQHVAEIPVTPVRRRGPNKPKLA